MIRTQWIVCERNSRWASALRMALAAAGIRSGLRETRHLAALEAELAEQPVCLTAIEIHRGNFADVLSWLPSARQKFSQVRFVLLIDRSLSDDLEDVCDALFEAGAAAVAISPRRLDAILALAARHAANTPARDGFTPLTTQVWASLPWQKR